MRLHNSTAHPTRWRGRSGYLAYSHSGSPSALNREHVVDRLQTEIARARSSVGPFDMEVLTSRPGAWFRSELLPHSPARASMRSRSPGVGGG